MTASADPYVRDAAGRFARLPDVLLRDVPPIPTPVRVPDDVEPAPARDGRASFVPVAAPRCPHGSFMRWAVRNCRPCARSPR